MMAMMAAACATAERYYVPTTEEARITLDEMREHTDAILHVECPRLLRGRTMVYGEAELTLDIDSAGDVRRASLAHGSPSQRIDDVLGALAARLHLPRLGGAGASATLVAGWACAPMAETTTLRLGRAG
ncbi:MAG TPA: hypothetical protein VF041_11130 [Gemmatimonadaceae bacterium]